MKSVIGVRFKQAGKIYYFDPRGLEIEKDDNVIVETARGYEYGHVVGEKKTIVDDDFKHSLKPVIRVATPDDTLTYQENLLKEQHAYRVGREKIAQHGLEMKLLRVEYTFDSSKVIFYFTAEGRVDFRELVKDLASVFRTRIELRQIGVRDEAKMLSGVASCGRELCCASWLGDFQPVSIKMAKDQNLSLNPTKISGVCGRLMCCLNYEEDVYKILKKEMPRPGERLIYKGKPAEVSDISLLKEEVQLRIEGDDDVNELIWVKNVELNEPPEVIEQPRPKKRPKRRRRPRKQS
ncbi:MAG TPA: stage 0 sporulation family protein [Tissierellia bacterium]|nr:stage 0 sporulation family protein [Tissierellia bacterium]